MLTRQLICSSGTKRCNSVNTDNLEFCRYHLLVGIIIFYLFVKKTDTYKLFCHLSKMFVCLLLIDMKSLNNSLQLLHKNADLIRHAEHLHRLVRGMLAFHEVGLSAS